MRVSVLHGIADVRVEHRPRPVPAPGHVLVRVLAVGTCGSDTHYYEHGRIGDHVVSQPLVLGHESAGVIVALGDGVGNLAVDQRVSIEPGVPCSRCTQCRVGRYNLCADVEFFGTPPFDGAFAEYVTIPASFAHPVPDSMSDEAAALLEPLSVAVWACHKGEVTVGKRVLVTGAGPIGLVMVQTARAFGASEVTVSDVNVHRLKVARELGASRVLDASADELGHGYDVLLECSGVPRVITDGIRSLGAAGRAVCVGMGGEEVMLPLSAVQNKEVVVTGTFRYANTWPTAMDLVTSGAVDLDSLVTHRYGLDQVADALTNARRHPEAVKAIVRP